ncbi:MAG: DUF427 domain-containing protein [Pseudomonadota bacterium]
MSKQDPRDLWQHRGQQRPAFAKLPGPGQESVWDYPRPPCIVLDKRTIEVHCGADRLVHSTKTLRILETASPPTVYIPQTDINMEMLEICPGRSFCEWKGAAQYLAVKTAPELGAIAWWYPEPNGEFEQIREHLSFYPAKVACSIDGERVRPQSGGFYGGWVTQEIVGPYKGEPGTEGW